MTKAHEPNDISRAQVKCWAEWLPERIIAKRVQVSVPTLRKHYRSELLDAPMDKNMEVVKALYRNATVKGNVTAQIFWIKYRLGIKEDGSMSGAQETTEAQPLEIKFEVSQPVGDIRVTEGEERAS